MRVHKTNDPASEYQLYDYKDIVKVTFQKETLNDKMAIHERWSFEFKLHTEKRDFVLYAPSLDERTLWVHTFYWIASVNEAILKEKAFNNAKGSENKEVVDRKISKDKDGRLSALSQSQRNEIVKKVKEK
jgi:hypothetical protein